MSEPVSIEIVTPDAVQPQRAASLDDTSAVAIDAPRFQVPNIWMQRRRDVPGGAHVRDDSGRIWVPETVSYAYDPTGIAFIRFCRSVMYARLRYFLDTEWAPGRPNYLARLPLGALSGVKGRMAQNHGIDCHFALNDDVLWPIGYEAVALPDPAPHPITQRTGPNAGQPLPDGTIDGSIDFAYKAAGVQLWNGVDFSAGWSACEIMPVLAPPVAGKQVATWALGTFDRPFDSTVVSAAGVIGALSSFPNDTVHSNMKGEVATNPSGASNPAPTVVEYVRTPHARLLPNGGVWQAGTNTVPVDWMDGINRTFFGSAVPPELAANPFKVGDRAHFSLGMNIFDNHEWKELRQEGQLTGFMGSDGVMHRDIGYTASGPGTWEVDFTPPEDVVAADNYYSFGNPTGGKHFSYQSQANGGIRNWEATSAWKIDPLRYQRNASYLGLVFLNDPTALAVTNCLSISAADGVKLDVTTYGPGLNGVDINRARNVTGTVRLLGSNKANNGNNSPNAGMDGDLVSSKDNITLCLVIEGPNARGFQLETYSRGWFPTVTGRLDHPDYGVSNNVGLFTLIGKSQADIGVLDVEGPGFRLVDTNLPSGDDIAVEFLVHEHARVRSTSRARNPEIRLFHFADACTIRYEGWSVNADPSQRQRVMYKLGAVGNDVEIDLPFVATTTKWGYLPDGAIHYGEITLPAANPSLTSLQLVVGAADGSQAISTPVNLLGARVSHVQSENDGGGYPPDTSDDPADDGSGTDSDRTVWSTLPADFTGVGANDAFVWRTANPDGTDFYTSFLRVMPPLPVTVTSGNPTIDYGTGRHGAKLGDRVLLDTTIGNLTADTSYWVAAVINNNQLQLTATRFTPGIDTVPPVLTPTASGTATTRGAGVLIDALPKALAIGTTVSFGDGALPGQTTRIGKYATSLWSGTGQPAFNNAKLQLERQGILSTIVATYNSSVSSTSDDVRIVLNMRRERIPVGAARPAYRPKPILTGNTRDPATLAAAIGIMRGRGALTDQTTTLGWSRKVASADVGRTTTTANTDPDLSPQFMKLGDVWRITGLLAFNGPSAADVKLVMGAPAGATIEWRAEAQAASQSGAGGIQPQTSANLTNDANPNTTQQIGLADGSTNMVAFEALVKMGAVGQTGAVAGTVTFGWGQGTANATAVTRERGSVLLYEQLS